MAEPIPFPPGTRLYEVITTNEESEIQEELYVPAKDLRSAMIMLLREHDPVVSKARSISVREAE